MCFLLVCAVDFFVGSALLLKQFANEFEQR
jgi:hypothetical protein